MTRPMHPQTEPQRAASAEAAPRQHRERGFEPRDANPRLVLAAVGAFLALMATGLIAAALTLRKLDVGGGLPRAASAIPAGAPSPTLLADPASDRAAYERVMAGRPDPAARARAAAALEARGWGEDASPPPAAQKAARSHREAMR